MKVPGLWILLFLVGTALPGRSFFTDVVFTHGDTMTMTPADRELKGNRYNPSNEKKSNLNLEDYNPIDPVPSSKASIKPGPIEHGSPLNPYIPGPTPPSHPNDGVFN